MKYRITESDFYYIPEPENADANFDSVVWEKENVWETDNLAEVLTAMSNFNTKYYPHTVLKFDYEDCVTLRSDSNLDPLENYVMRHTLDVNII